MTDDLTTPIRQLRYVQTREDIAAYHFLPRELVGLEKLWLFGPILLCGAAAGFFEDELRALLPWDPGSQSGQLATVLIAIAIGYGLSLVLLTARTRQRINSTRLAPSGTAVDVYPQLFLVTEDDDYRSYVWSEAAIADTDTHVFITQGTRKPVIIPLRAFDSLEDMQDFVSKAEAWHNAAEIAAEEAQESGKVTS